MVLKVSNDIDRIKALLFDDYISKKAGANELKTKEDLDLAIGSVIYIVGSEKDNDFGLSCFHKYRDGLKMHPYILESHKSKYREFVKKSVDMINCSLYVELDNRDKLLINLAKKLGFDSFENNKSKIILKR